MRRFCLVTPGVTRSVALFLLILMSTGTAWSPAAEPASEALPPAALDVPAFSPASSHSVLRVADNAPSGDAVASGIELERSKQWLQAIEHYEAAVKKSPENKDLQYGLRRSKIHFAIERRYADNSFERKLLPKSRSEALVTFDEVLNQVRSNYVEQLSATSFVAHGTESFYLSLANERFLKRNLPNADRERVSELRGILRDRYWNKPVASDAAARSTVIEVCDLASSTTGVAPGAVIMEYVFGGCNSLDDYSSFLTPDRLDDLYGNIDGEFVGLGIEMKAEAGKGMLLVHVLPESPAAEGGLKDDDHIVMIEGQDCTNMTTDEAAKLLRGPSNSRVTLRVTRPGDDRTWEGSFVRRAVHVKSVPVAKIIDKANGIGYIQMTGFQKTTTSELDEALSTLQKQGMRSVIWDLRGNPGGLLTTAVEVLDRFVADGVLVSTRGRSQDQNWTYSAHKNGTLSMPLVLLVDGDSASASEIVAGAVKDHRRGTIVGRQTFGKWSVQSIFPLKEQTGLRLTTAKFYSPNGNNYSKVGVKPDVLIEAEETAHKGSTRRSRDKSDLSSDPDIAAGLNVLRRDVTSR